MPFDKNNSNQKSSFGAFVDHKKMKTFEYAAFQKRLHTQRKLDAKRRKLLIILTILAVILIFLTLPFIVKTIFDPSYQSVQFQN
jgi:hypothetical protein